MLLNEDLLHFSVKLIHEEYNYKQNTNEGNELGY